MEKSETITELSKALAEFQKEVKQPLKDKNNPFFKSKYVPLENVVEAITDIAPNHGLSFVQWALNNDNGQVGVATILMHTSGEYIQFDPVFMKAEKQTPQGYGALITYIKRYTLSAIIGITSDQDDDANESSGNSQKKQQKQVSKSVILAKFKQGGGTEEQFNEWFGKQVAAGVTNNQMDELLTKKLTEKK